MPALATTTSRPPRRADGRLDGAVDLLAVGDVAARQGAPRTAPATSAEQLGLQARERHAGALRVQPLGEGGADAAGGAGDQHAAPGQARQAHRGLPWRRIAGPYHR